MGRHPVGAEAVELGVDPGVDRPAQATVLATAHVCGTRRGDAVIPSECDGADTGSRGVTGTPAPSDERRRHAFAVHVVPEIEVLLRVARTLVARPADAEDLVQDTLVRAYKAVDSFDGRHPRAWLLTIMRNAEINRTRRRRPDLLDDPDAALDRVDRDDDDGLPETVVVGAAFDTVVVEALDALPDRFRRVVELVDIDGLTYAEAAEALGTPVGTVMSRLHRARARIRDRLAAAGLAPRRGEE